MRKRSRLIKQKLLRRGSCVRIATESQKKSRKSLINKHLRLFLFY
nr:MAG TPA: hypothetical protein [Caudoviricetes sp.]